MDRRTLLLAAVCLGVLAAAFLLLRPPSSPADVGDAPAETPRVAKQAPANLPISRVVLFSSGVGYFQREGEVEGNARVDLSFPAANINDLLKSMVLEDLNGGHISAVSFESHDPLDKTLQNFAVNLNNNPSLSNLLQQARGEKVEVVLNKRELGQPDTLTGTVLGIEQPASTVPPGSGTYPTVAAYRNGGGKDTRDAAESVVLNLSCGDGLHGVRLNEIQRVKFLNPKFEGELQRALEVLAASHDAGKKAVTLNFTGEGKRRVRVGYVVETPLWRTSYRLVLRNQGKPFLQGWAVVENPSNEDWKDVNMALVSGRPISFQMDLYQPLYVSRPIVQPELYASIRPTTHAGNLNAPVAVAAAPMPAGAPVPYQPMLTSNGTGAGADQRIQFAAVTPAPQMQWAVPNGVLNGALPVPAQQAQGINPQRGVVSAAEAKELGNFFQYAVQHPVSLPRQRSAMIPIVSKEVEASRVSVYNETAHVRHPLLAVRLKNSSGVHLMQGPVTVFDGGAYAGDAQLQDLEPDEERLVSYAIDLGTEVEALPAKCNAHATAVKIQRGVVSVTSKVREQRTYNVKNRSPHARLLVLEHPFRSEYELVGEIKAKERARDVYRFELKVAAGKSGSLEIAEEREAGTNVALANAEGGFFRTLLVCAAKSDTATTALIRLLKLKENWSAGQQDLGKRLHRLHAITEDQKRLRANLAEMPKAAAAYKRYLDKFDSQETEIEKLQDEIKSLQETEAQRRQAYESALLQLDLEFVPAEPLDGLPGLVVPGVTTSYRGKR